MAGILSDIQEIYGWLQYFKDVHDTIEGNKQKCYCLIERCQRFEGSLADLEKNKVPVTKQVEANVHGLLKVVKECGEFVKKYGEKGWKRWALNAAFCQGVQSQFEELNVQLDRASADLQLGLAVDSRKRMEAATKQDLTEYMAMIGEFSEIQQKSTVVSVEKLGEKLGEKLHVDVQSGSQAVMEEVRKLFEKFTAEQCERTSALFELVNQQQQQPSLSGSGDGSGKSVASAAAVSPQATVSQKSVFDDLKFASIDVSCLSWDKNDKLGKGSFASVYKCTYEGRDCALKHFENIGMLSSKELRSIKREARIMQVAKHLNIIDFIGFDVSSGIIVCELAKAALFDVLHNDTNPLCCTLSFEVKLEWLVDIAQALRYLHFHGIIHRDIKPQNILLTQHSAGSRVVAKVSDFGISTAVGMTTMGTAAAADASRSSTSAAGSTPYMAPELIDFDESGPVYSPAVDVYAFGVTANETLSEQVPWEGLKVRQIEKAVEKGMRPKPFCGVSECEKAVCRLIGDAGCGMLSGDAMCRPSAGVLVSSLREELSKNQAAAAVIDVVAANDNVYSSDAATAKKTDTEDCVTAPTSEESQQQKNSLSRIINQSSPSSSVSPSQWSQKASWVVGSYAHVKFSPDGSVIAVAPWDRSNILIYDPSGRLISTLKVTTSWFSFIKTNISCLSFSPDGTKLAASSYDDNSVKLFEVSSGRLLWSTTINRTYQVCFFNSSTLVASEGGESCVIIDVSSGSITSRISADCSKGLCVSNRGTLITAGCSKVTIWDNLNSQRLSFKCSDLWSMCINSDGSLINVGTIKGDILVFSVSGLIIGEVKKAHDGYVTLSMNETNSVLASCGGKDNKVKLWNASTLECIQTLEGHTGSLWSVSFSPNNNLVSGSDDKTVRLWSCC